VRALAATALEKAFAWKAYGRLVSISSLLDLILLMSCLKASLSGCVSRFRFGFGRETARKAIAANLPKDIDVLTDGLVTALYSFLDPAMLKNRWDIAIDLHECPFYGDRDAPGVTGGKKKQGTKFFYAYATAVLIHQRKRYTVGLIPFKKGMKPHEVVKALLDQVAARGLRVRGVALDSGFDSGEVLLLLKDRNLAYVVPLRRKGKGTNRRNACFSLPEGTVTKVAWTTERSNKPVETWAVVFKRSKDERIMVYAFGGWSKNAACLTGEAQEARRKREAKLAKKKYRRRFGIETSYRQKNEGKAKTTKKDDRYRLLLEGTALLLRQAWVHLTEQIAKAKKAKRKAWIKDLTLRRLVDWLADELKQHHPEQKEIDLGKEIDFPKGMDKKKKTKTEALEDGAVGKRGGGGPGQDQKPPGQAASAPKPEPGKAGP
jgi:hypothetical protein